LRIASVLIALLVGTAAHGQIQSDWERANEERLKQSNELAVPPPALERGRLVEVKLRELGGESDFRYYVDWGSVSAGEDRIVRYVLVARSRAGAENVTFEGLRCQGEYRVYAVGRTDGGWSGRPSEWRPIPRNANAIQPVLARQYFCPGRAAVRTSAEAQRAVRDGGHPGIFRELEYR
jgi:hypothetical protein